MPTTASGPSSHALERRTSRPPVGVGPREQDALAEVRARTDGRPRGASRLPQKQAERAQTREVARRIESLLLTEGADQPSEVALLAARAYAVALLGLLTRVARDLGPSSTLDWRTEKQRNTLRRSGTWPALVLVLRSALTLAEEVERLPP